MALAGIGVIALTPVAAHPCPVKFRSVQLTTFLSDVDPSTAWQDVLNLAESNATALSDHFEFAPFIALQQVIENQTGYIDGFPGNAGQILPEIRRRRSTTWSTFRPTSPMRRSTVNSLTERLRRST